MRLVFVIYFSYLLTITHSAINNITVFDANTSYQWEHQNITCPQDAPCKIICDEGYSCKDSIVTCPDNYQCDIVCNVWYSCEDILIQPPLNQSLFSLDFAGSGSLVGVTYPIYPLDDYQNFTLVCDAAGQCKEMHIICPRYASCSIICDKTYSCDTVKTFIFIALI